jgi:hypothetical protein
MTEQDLAELFEDETRSDRDVLVRLVVQHVSVDGIGPETEPNPPQLVPQDPPAPDGLDRARRALELPASE